ncbi:MAG: DUF3795 domain-containing protein [Sporomusaceae bacterium]|nr:DUF3795 domain-containing protein [Sporomusaceae bacterium]
MEKSAEFDLAAPCGIFCGECRVFKARDDEKLREALIAAGIPKEKVPCPGCRPGRGDCPVLSAPCETYACISERGLNFCYECREFPCTRLNPAADRANVLPHNIKVFNLCYIQHQGLAAWLEKAPEIQRKYYAGKMAIGKGPQLD